VVELYSIETGLQENCRITTKLLSYDQPTHVSPKVTDLQHPQVTSAMLQE
jgi:hypothetical protein